MDTWSGQFWLLKRNIIFYFPSHKSLNMDDASEDSRPAQPGLIKKFFLTISTVRDSLAMLLFFIPGMITILIPLIH